MKNKCHIGYKILWGKKKLLVTSDFTFSHNVFYSYIYLKCVKMRYCVVMGYFFFISRSFDDYFFFLAKKRKTNVEKNHWPCEAKHIFYLPIHFLICLTFYLFLTHSHTMTPFDAPEKQAFWKHCGKGEIARNEQFLLFPQCFLPIWITFCHFRQLWNCRLQSLSVWKSLKFVVW